MAVEVPALLDDVGLELVGDVLDGAGDLGVLARLVRVHDVLGDGLGHGVPAFRGAVRFLGTIIGGAPESVRRAAHLGC